jgi:hypothetical protein
MLKFISVSENKTRDKHIKWFCQCDCGDISEYLATHVRNNKKTQCKKCSRKLQGEAKKTHGLRNTGTYSTWNAIKTRCLNKKSKDYSAYGGAGIYMCQEWVDSFEQFYLDMGERPKGRSIDRIDNTKGYFKENCRWATRSEQQQNKQCSRIWIIKGVTFKSMQEAADYFKVTKQTIGKWVFGWHDKRRNKQWEPKNDCRTINKY